MTTAPDPAKEGCLLQRSEIEGLFAALAKANPNPQTELVHDSPFDLLVAVLLSARSTDKKVNEVTQRLFAEAPTPQALADMPLERITELVSVLGFFRNKAKNLKAMAQMLVEDFAGDVPRTQEELMRLPGIGRKSANVVLNTVFGEPVLGVDTHIFRVANRTGLAVANTPEKVERILSSCVPEGYLQHAHHLLVLHGRYVCLARKPKCDACLISRFCLDFRARKKPAQEASGPI